MNQLLNYFKKKEKEGFLDPKAYQTWLKDNKKMILLDVRTPEEFRESHLPNAELFPVQWIELHFMKHYQDKDMTYVIYCRSGIRSYNALKMLKQMGYLHVYDMGGIIHYPYEILTGSKEENI